MMRQAELEAGLVNLHRVEVPRLFILETLFLTNIVEVIKSQKHILKYDMQHSFFFFLVRIYMNVC